MNQRAGTCEAGLSCSMCLHTISASECPGGWASEDAGDIPGNCASVAEGELCEADGECGTNDGLNNCYTSTGDGGWDVYRRGELRFRVLDFKSSRV
jgi:hypothetical protein